MSEALKRLPVHVGDLDSIDLYSMKFELAKFLF